MDLAELIADVDCVRVTEVGRLDPRRRHGTKYLLVISDAAEIASLRDALVIDPRSLEEELALMTPGAFDLNFMRGHDLRATVTYLGAPYVRWRGWRWDAQLRDPQQLVDWLQARGWSESGHKFESSSSG
jgi:hypothetical protein